MTWLERIELAGLVIAAASLVCSVVNAAIRAAAEHGYRVPRWLLVVAAAANAAALNLDKADQFRRGYRGPSLPRDRGLP